MPLAKELMSSASKMTRLADMPTAMTWIGMHPNEKEATSCNKCIKMLHCSSLLSATRQDATTTEINIQWSNARPAATGFALSISRRMTRTMAVSRW
jgi:hypothetical protein